MKLYNETVRCDVRLPRHAIEVVDREAKRTGIQRAVFLRSVILKWIEKEHNPATGAAFGDNTSAAGGQQPQRSVADA